MTTYQILPASALDTRTRYPRLDWPADRLAVGEAFVVPLANGRDPDGRPESYVRVLADKLARRLGRKFSCRKVEGGLAIQRIA